MNIEALKQRRIGSVVREVAKKDYILNKKNYEKADEALKIIYKKFDLAMKAGATLNDFPIDIRNEFYS